MAVLQVHIVILMFVDTSVPTGRASMETGGEAQCLQRGVMVAYVVDLESGVGDAILPGEELFEFAPAGVAIFSPADEDVGGEGRKTRGDGPDVKVVDLDYAFGCRHLSADFPGVQSAGGRFEQDVGRVPEERPGAAQNKEPDGDADQGVRVAPAGQDNDSGGDHRTDRAEGVCEHVTHGSLYVQALAPRAVEDGGTDRVDEES